MLHGVEDSLPMQDDGRPITSDRELWACALHILGAHGEEAIPFVADRVAALAQAGYEADVKTWRMIADRIDALRDGAAADQARH
jgi:hypothetical protein